MSLKEKLITVREYSSDRKHINALHALPHPKIAC
jgi:hypothetical protein